METIDLRHLQALSDHRSDFCVSIYMPTFRAGFAAQQNPVRLKNLLHTAQKTILDGGWIRKSECDAWFTKAIALEKDLELWQSAGDGLALFFSSSGLQEYYRLPVVFEESVEVGKHFRLSPLFPLFTADGTFYLLDLDIHNVRLFECTRFSLQRIYPPGLPRTLEEIAAGTERFPAREDRTHDDRESVLKLFRQVDPIVRRVLNGKRAPLLLAGVDALFPLFRTVCSYPLLMEEGIVGNQKDTSLEELRVRAWKIAGPAFDTKKRAAIGRFAALAGTGRTTHELSRILNTAMCGGVETLFVAGDRTIHGNLNSEEDNLYPETLVGAKGEELLNLAALHAFVNQGEVFVLPSTEMPQGHPIAAVLRKGQEYHPPAAMVSNEVAPVFVR